VPYYTNECENLRAQVAAEYKAGPKFCNAAFVTFNTVSTAVKATDTPITNEDTWRVEKTTRPTAILWENLCTQPSGETQATLTLLSQAAIASIIIFWSVPFAFGAALANLSTLGDKYPFLSGAEDIPAGAAAIIEGLGPTLWRILLTAMVEPMFYYIISWRLMTKESELEHAVMFEYYMFYLIQIYFVTLITSSVFTTLGDIIAEPIRTFELLGEHIPEVSIQMIQYITLEGLGFGGLGAGQFFKLLKLAFRILKAETSAVDIERRATLMKRQPFPFGPSLSLGLLVWTVTCAYSAIAPLILPFACMFFSVSYIVGKYQLVYVQRPSFETFGLFWPTIANSMINGLVLSQLVLMIVIGLRYGSYQQIFLFPLPVFTYFYGCRLYSSWGEQMSKNRVALSEAWALDKYRSKNAVMAFLAKSHETNVWVQPCVNVDLTDPLKPVPPPPELDANTASLSEVKLGHISENQTTLDGKDSLRSGDEMKQEEVVPFMKGETVDRSHYIKLPV